MLHCSTVNTMTFVFGTMYLIQPFKNALSRLQCFMQAAEQAEANLGLANGRVPPTWSLERDKYYPLRTYIQDLEMWSAATDMQEERMAPAVVLRLTGAARNIVREVPVDLLRDGQDFIDANGQQAHRTGLQVLVRLLQQRYGALPQEQQIFAVSELMTFHRLHHETTDEMIARWDVVMFRAIEQGGVVAFNPVIRAWIILTHLRIPRHLWPTILAPTQGLLPQTEAEYVAMIAYVRRNSHLHEVHGDRSKTLQQPYFLEESSSASVSQPTYSAWTADSAWDQYGDYSGSGWDYTYASDMQDDTHSWHSFSTANSEQHDELDWTDVEHISPGELNEYLYHQYVFAKRRFRAVGFKRHRYVGRPKGKGKGQRRGRKGKGKGGHGKHQAHSSGFWTDEWPTETDHDSEVDLDRIYFAGGKGGKGKGRGNPIGKDGLQMTCDDCGSTEHFKRNCTKGKSKGKGKGKSSKPSHGKSSAPASFHANAEHNPAYHAASEYPQPSASTHASMFMLTDQFAEQSERKPHTRITFMDGSPDVEILPARAENAVQNSSNFWTNHDALQTAVSETSTNLESAHAARHDLFYAWWPTSDADLAADPDQQVSYHSKVRLSSGESLLIDTGAIKPLAGDQWVKRASAAAEVAGRGTSFVPLDRPLSVEGVGQGSNNCTERAVVPIAMEDGVTGTYSPAVVPQSEIPALVGFDTLERRRVLLDCFNGKYYEIGAGGYDIQLSPGSRLLHLHKAPTGHPMLPATQWDKVKPGPSQAYTNM